MRVIPLLAALAILQSGGSAQNPPQKPQRVIFWSPMSGEELVDKCKDAGSEEPAAGTEVQSLQCLVYISGFTDGYGAALIGFNNNKQAAFCPPEQVSLTQMARVLVKFGKDHPEKLWMRAYTVTLLALKDAYPCRTQ
jgi:hypothetical protein